MTMEKSNNIYFTNKFIRDNIYFTNKFIRDNIYFTNKFIRACFNEVRHT